MEKMLFNFRLKMLGAGQLFWKGSKFLPQVLSKSNRAGCQKDANKKKANHTIDNDEQTANTHKNPNGNSGKPT